LLIVAGASPALSPGHYVAALDAMRGDVFAAAFSLTDTAIVTLSPTTIVARADLSAFAREFAAHAIGPAEELAMIPHARGAAALGERLAWPPPADIGAWEPEYGRLAEAQVKWEAAHGRALTPR
jgi:tRNA threonylcarbamoyladenosine biosynthesis protein TsaB